MYRYFRLTTIVHTRLQVCIFIMIIIIAKKCYDHSNKKCYDHNKNTNDNSAHALACVQKESTQKQVRAGEETPRAARGYSWWPAEPAAPSL